MKIGNTPNDAVNGASGSGRAEGTPGATSGAARAGRSESTGVEASAKVSLSPMAGDLLGGTDASFDAEKVARVKQAIDEGSYKINAEAIADKLIANAQEVLGRKAS